jgi:hypothetical protein
MPRTEQVLSIFLASPGDVAEERARVKEVVDSWNLAWSRELSTRLELIRWESDAFPDAGEDAQDVINGQLPDDWDIFVGVMWCRFGTPTGRAGSGTHEEFLRAFERKQKSKQPLPILLYFKDEPLAPSRIDPLQLQQVLAFKDQVKSQGVFSWTFASAYEFEKLATLHLTKHVQKLRRAASEPVEQEAPTLSASQGTAPPPAAPEAEPQDQTTSSPLPAEDDGYLDLLESFSQQSVEITQISERLNAAQNHLTARTVEAHEKLERLRENSGSADSKSLRAVLSTVADEMVAYTTLVKEEIPSFRSALDRTMTTLVRLMNVSAEIYPDQLASSKAAAFELLKTLSTSKTAIQGFLASTMALPKMTKELAAAKRGQATALAGLIAEFEHGERLLSEGIAAITEMSARTSHDA